MDLKTVTRAKKDVPRTKNYKELKTVSRTKNYKKN